MHLLDGGTADNLALSAPLEAATGGDAGGRLRSGLRDGKIKEIVVISVNARSQGAAPGPDTSTPGIFSMLLGTINTSIDSGSGGLSAQMDALEAVLRQHYPNRPTVVRRISLDFERIADAACRAAFQGIATSWTLKPVEVDALQEMASAMLRNDQQYLALSGGPRNPAMGQARAKAACRRLLKQEGPPLVFGG